MSRGDPVRVPIRLRAALSACALLAVISSPAIAETPGKDGALTVSASNIILNEYARISGAATAGSTSLTGLNLAVDMPSLSAGDLIMIYQARGATISGAAGPGYGAVTSLGSAGRYEFQTVASVSGNTITFETYGGGCGGLTYSYQADRAQIIRVPQYTTLTVNGGASVIAQSWNGQTGGVIAVHVEGHAIVNGTLNASGRGFRGGAVDNVTTPPSQTGPAGYSSAAPADGAEKGESIAGWQDDYPGGRYQRGAPANGGGGGNAHNAGGGGGANGDNGTAWNGQGNPDLSVAAWAQAWDIDGTLTSATTSSGGGRGGYTYARDGDALTTPPGATAWGNDFRREVGGLGGRPLTYDRTGRLYFGGGGGAGDGNNNAAGAGGRGGGIAFIIADTVLGSGTIRANGWNGQDTSPSHNDAPGGGGGGGTVVIQADALSGVGLRAAGGRGGNQLITNNENEGPGGGGGGGVLAYLGGLPGSTNANGGTNGTTTATSMTEFIPNGATRGGLGQPNATAPTDAELPFCFIPQGEMTGAKSMTPWPGSASPLSIPGSEVIYTLGFENVGYTPISDGSIVITDPLPPEVSFYNDEFDSTSAPVTGPIEFIDTGSGLTCCNSGQVDYSDSLSPPPVFGYTPATGHDPNVRYIRIRPDGEMNPQSSFEVKFRTLIK